MGFKVIVNIADIINNLRNASERERAGIMDHMFILTACIGIFIAITADRVSGNADSSLVYTFALTMGIILASFFMCRIITKVIK